MCWQGESSHCEGALKTIIKILSVICFFLGLLRATTEDLSELWEEIPPKLEFIYKKLYIYSYMFKLQSPSKYSIKAFFLLLKTVSELVDLDTL